MTSGGLATPVPALPRELAAFLSDVTRRFGPNLDLSEILAETTKAVVELLGFGLAVLNLVTPEGPLEVVAVEGPEEACAVLLGSSSTREEWDLLLSDAGASGALRFVPHDSPALAHEVNGITRWVPSEAVSTDDAWTPGDELFAPLYAADGELLGVLSVDLPPLGRRPDVRVLELLELFAVQAALALDHARLHARLIRSEALLRRTFEQAPVGMAVYSEDHRLEHANPAYCAFIGLPLEDMVGRRITEFTQADDREEVAALDRAVQDLGDAAVRVERRHVRPDGSVRWGRLTLTSLDSGYGESHVLAQLEDVTATRRAARALERRARTDPLTGLDNRRTVLAHLTRLLQGPGLTAVLYCDVDCFKRVNDTLGHAAGDALLIEVARNLAAVLRPTDHAGRLGGDEFVLVLEDVDPEVALEVAERVRKAARRVVKIDGQVQLTSLTIGVALGGSGTTAEALLDTADRALLRGKSEGRDRVVLA